MHVIFTLHLLVRVDDIHSVQRCSVYYVCLGFIVAFKPSFAKAGKYLKVIRNKENSTSM